LARTEKATNISEYQSGERLEQVIFCIWNCVNLLFNEPVATIVLTWREGKTTAMMSMVKWRGMWNKKKYDSNYFTTLFPNWLARGLCASHYANTADISIFRIWGFHSGGYEEYRPLGYDAV
jgi:hypothetical protein